MAKVFKVAVTWEMCGCIDVKADSLEDAIALVKADNEDYPLPDAQFYVDGSFRPTTEDVEEMKEMCN